MNSVLRKMLRLATEKNLPVIVFDSHSNRAGVLMNLDYFESHFDSEYGPGDEFVEEDEEIGEDLEEIPEFSSEYLEDESEDDLDQQNKDLALWRAKREDKEREEIERILEEELAENPPADPFEEDYLHTPEWHKIGESRELASDEHRADQETKKSIEISPKEPSYHPVLNTAGALSWTDWTFTPQGSFQVPPETIILQEKIDESMPEEDEQEPVFLEEPV